jgi:hypothetical protein
LHIPLLQNSKVSFAPSIELVNNALKYKDKTKLGVEVKRTPATL